jgi:importin-7
VRLQVDNSNAWNVKRQNQDMIKTICSIRQTRKQKISPHLPQYLNIIVESMQQPASDDFRPKEALMHAFGLLSTHMAQTPEYQKHAI